MIEPAHKITPGPPHSNERKALILAGCTVALWSTVATGFKLGLREMEPLQLLWLGCLFSLVFFAGVALAQRAFRPDPARKKIPAKLFALAMGLGVLNPFAYYATLFAAYDRLPAHIAQPLNFTWAITLAVLAVPILKQRLSVQQIAGILVSYLGVLVLLTQGSFSGTMRFDGLGVALALGSTFIWAMYWLWSTRITLAPLPMLLVAFATGTPLVGIACALTVGFPALTPINLAFGAWVGLVEMGISFLLWQTALGLTRNTARLGQLIFLSPFVSLFLLESIVGEQVHPSAWTALGLIVVGLLIGQRNATR